MMAYTAEPAIVAAYSEVRNDGEAHGGRFSWEKAF